MPRLARLYRTVRDLKAVQIIGRVSKRRIRRVNTNVEPPVLRPSSKKIAWQFWREVEYKDKQLRVFDEMVDTSRVEAWHNESQDPLKHYHLHYLEFLGTSTAISDPEVAHELLEDWRLANPPFRGKSWDPYPCSRRLIHLTRWFLSTDCADDELARLIFLHGRFIEKNFETHLQANHLFTNICSLLCAASLFEGDEANSWLHKGSAMLKTELDRQFLSDGGHVERSPMYHALMLEDFLDTLMVLRRFDLAMPANCGDLIAKAIAWLAAMSLPCGRLFRFNDTADNMSAPVKVLAAMAEQLDIKAVVTPGDGMTVLADSGYVRWSSSRYDCVFDVGDIGPNYQPGHAHCDTLSFELVIDGKAQLVNTGTSTYHDSARRNIERGTSAHNTVSVAGLEQSEIWGSFRVGRKARASVLGQGDNWLEAAHDGFRPQGTSHSRRLEFQSERILISDTVRPDATEPTAHFAFAPGIALASDGPNAFRSPKFRLSFSSKPTTPTIYDCAATFFALTAAEKTSVSFSGELDTRIELLEG